MRVEIYYFNWLGNEFFNTADFNMAAQYLERHAISSLNKFTIELSVHIVTCQEA